MSDYWHKEWVCPFFMGATKKRIVCEGESTFIFPDKDSATQYMDEYCSNINGYCKCTLADALLKYYERIDEHEKQ